jgi:hypothetical protein
MPIRGDFVKNCSSMDPHKERFNMNENYDRSTYLTKVRRIQGRDFDSYSKRKSENLIRQGGDCDNYDIIKPGTKTQEYYQTE